MQGTLHGTVLALSSTQGKRSPVPKPENIFYAFHTSLGASSPNKSGSGAKKALLKETQQLMNDLFKQQMPALAYRAVSFPVLSKVAAA